MSAFETPRIDFDTERNPFVGLGDRRLNLLELALDSEGDRYSNEAEDARMLGQDDRAEALGEDAREHYRLMSEVNRARHANRNRSLAGQSKPGYELRSHVVTSGEAVETDGEIVHTESPEPGTLVVWTAEPVDAVDEDEEAR